MFNLQDQSQPKSFQFLHFRIVFFELEAVVYIVEPRKVSKIGPVDYDDFRRQCVKYLNGLRNNMGRSPSHPQTNPEFAAIAREFAQSLRFWTTSLLNEKVAI